MPLDIIRCDVDAACLRDIITIILASDFLTVMFNPFNTFLWRHSPGLGNCGLNCKYN